MAIEGYKSISDAWNAPIPEAGKTFQQVKNCVQQAGVAVGLIAGIVLSLQIHSDRCDVDPSGLTAEAYLNQRQAKADSCHRASKECFGAMFFGTIGGGVLGWALTEGARQLAYRSARVAQYIFKNRMLQQAKVESDHLNGYKNAEDIPNYDIATRIGIAVGMAVSRDVCTNKEYLEYIQKNPDYRINLTFNATT